MTDLITAEDAEKLLDGSTPGPWEWTTGRFSNNPYLSPNILLLAFDGGGPDGVDPNDAANARLIAAAPDLARSVIALHAHLADAEAAQAMVGEKALNLLDYHVTNDDDRMTLRQAILALAPASGLALVRELRAESETSHQLHLEQVRITNEWIAERDRLAAANAVLEAKVAGLLDAIRDEMKTRSAYAVGSGGATTAREKFAAWSAASERLRVLATQEAGK